MHVPVEVYVCVGGKETEGMDEASFWSWTIYGSLSLASLPLIAEFSL